MTFDQSWLINSVAQVMFNHAKRSKRYNGLATSANQLLLDSCRFVHLATGTQGIFSFDTGHHSSGWWKNPEYERCWHLSLSFHDPETLQLRDKDSKLTEMWLDAFYHSNKRYVWTESAYSDHGKKARVWHYRVFCDQNWQPFIPRGEVYNKELTEAGWLSYSDLKSAEAKLFQQLTPGPGEQ